MTKKVKITGFRIISTQSKIRASIAAALQAVGTVIFFPTTLNLYFQWIDWKWFLLSIAMLVIGALLGTKLEVEGSYYEDN
jgi:uncharacterized membrane protein YfcA